MGGAQSFGYQNSNQEPQQQRRRNRVKANSSEKLPPLSGKPDNNDEQGQKKNRQGDKHSQEVQKSGNGMNEHAS